MKTINCDMCGEPIDSELVPIDLGQTDRNTTRHPGSEGYVITGYPLDFDLCGKCHDILFFNKTRLRAKQHVLATLKSHLSEYRAILKEMDEKNRQKRKENEKKMEEAAQVIGQVMTQSKGEKAEAE